MDKDMHDFLIALLPIALIIFVLFVLNKSKFSVKPGIGPKEMYVEMNKQAIQQQAEAVEILKEIRDLLKNKQ